MSSQHSPWGTYPRNITDCLEHWAVDVPDRVFLAQRDQAGDWRSITYAETLHSVRAIAQALLDRRLSSRSRVLILSGNSIEHALLALACLHVGVLYVPVSPAYSFAPPPFTALNEIWSGLKPALVFADDVHALQQLLESMLKEGTAELVTGKATSSLRATSFDELLSVKPTSLMDEVHARVDADAAAKILYTSGSTGRPKGVLTTHRMLCSNQEMLRSVLCPLHDGPPVVCDWLPWSHVYGGSHNFGAVLYGGGTLYIDEGRPSDARFSMTKENLREIAPTITSTYPKAFPCWCMLCGRMRV